MTKVNCNERAVILFYLIKNQVDTKKFKAQLLSDDFGLATLPSSLQKKMSVTQ
jgi:hypothetical protein